MATSSCQTMSSDRPSILLKNSRISIHRLFHNWTHNFSKRSIADFAAEDIKIHKPMKTSAILCGFRS